MTGEMWRRGPDADGFFSNNFVAFGHRRLAIIDLTESGRQPMADHTGQYWITFNGEIYNFGEVRRELEQSGAQFRSTSDTEVILEAYKRWGDECLQRFNGMFAFALWDNLKQRCLLARDRLGKKPLFYAVLGNGDLIFASELKALLRSGLIPWRLNTEALSQYLSLGYVLSNACILDGVKKLEPASAMVVERDRPIRIWRYWDLARLFSRKIKITESDAAAELRHLLNDSTRLRMISDVPLGAFLSGGIDSSSIVASMCQNSAAEQVETYSIGFSEKGYSELPEAGIVARHLGVSHHEQNVDVSMAKDLADIVYAADEPFADNSMVPTSICQRLPDVASQSRLPATAGMNCSRAMRPTWRTNSTILLHECRVSRRYSARSRRDGCRLPFTRSAGITKLGNFFRHRGFRFPKRTITGERFLPKLKSGRSSNRNMRKASMTARHCDSSTSSSTRCPTVIFSIEQCMWT